MRPTLVIAAIALSAAASWAPLVHAETLEIAGGTTPQKEVIEPKAAELKAATGIDIKFSGVGTGRGVLALIDGKVPVAAVGDTLADSVSAAQKAAKSEGREIKVPANLVFTEIGSDELVVIVHKSNPVASLNKAQLKGIATGKIVNWNEVGGPDLPIKVVVTEPSLAPGQFFKKAMMDGADYAQGATEVRSPKEVITWVSRNPGGFGAAADVFMQASPGDSKVVKAPLMVRPMGLVTIGPAAGAAKKVVDFYRKK
jgi:phosphate transport system substrate-binding protein